MSSKAKVGSWMGKGSAAAKAEAYESDSDAESSAASVISEIVDSKKLAAAEAEIDDDEDDEEAPTPAAVERELNIDWDVVLPKIRPALLDRSKKRREQFSARFLYVTDEGELRRSGEWRRHFVVVLPRGSRP